MENYDVNYDPNDIATNAPDFEEPHVENNHVAHFNGDPMQDESYRRYYEELKNSQNENLQAERQVVKSKNPQNLNLQDEKPAEISKNNKVYILKRPFEFEGEWIEELYLDLDSLTGRDIMDASKGVESYVQETDKTYLCNIAAKALKRPKEIMYFMSAKDATAICYEVSNFLIG
ncbi:hypothetical protein [uncultured Peptoniphilus sp.]|uniref:hypothetical protein n=1 Tax=uncultured Peptoniphilus sp. TaxID=254354 RepID=UPI002591D27E|nr:hypothetical protein [uncultured Peptoniphilus sp.]